MGQKQGPRWSVAGKSIAPWPRSHFRSQSDRRPLRPRLCCKSRKLHGHKFFAKTQNGKQSPICTDAIALSKSPVSLTSGDEDPHIFRRKPRLRPLEFLIIGAKRLLQHNRLKNGLEPDIGLRQLSAQQATCSTKESKNLKGSRLFRQRRDLLIEPGKIAFPFGIIRRELHQAVHDRLSLSQRRQRFLPIL